MPTVHNGIGTWYYGKRRIHRRKGVCSFCGRTGELESYDTTLYFVFFFIPLVSLGNKRVLEECPSCRKHRVVRLKDWEEAKAKDIARLMQQVEENPNDVETVRSAIGLSMAYQDEALFDQLATGLAEPYQADPAVQADLGTAYGYFARWAEAEAAYRKSLAARDAPEVRRQLAFALLKQGRPQDAEPLLRHVLDERLQDHAGMIYLLAEAYQAQGMHEDALAVMDRRDQAFPELVAVPEYAKQRATSERYRSSGKRIRSEALSESKTGYREGGWTARLPRLVGPVIALGLLAWYLYAAWHAGEARRVYLVNGWTKPYKVAVNGRELTLMPGTHTPVVLPEGEVAVEPRDAAVPLPPATCRVETPFFSRPFTRRTFVINPDQLAVLWREESTYAENPPAPPPPEVHLGQLLYEFRGIDYEFQPWPESVPVKRGQSVTKTRVALAPVTTSMQRLRRVAAVPDAATQTEYAKRLLTLDPGDTLFLYWLATRLPADDMIAFLTPRLDARPPLVEWHRAYQSVMDRAHPEQDLRPRYEKLVAETNGQPDALYLLARIQELGEGEELLRRAAGASPPSAYAQFALGFHALSEARFADAVGWLDKAVKRHPDNPAWRDEYEYALLAAGRYDQLLKELEGLPPQDLNALIGRLRVYAVRGDQAKVKAALDEADRMFRQPGQEQARQLIRHVLEAGLACAQGDEAKYLQVVSQVPQASAFEPALLTGDLDKAAAAVDASDDSKARAQRGLLYLAARQAGKRELADKEWKQLLDACAKGDRYTRRLGDVLAGRRPVDAEALRRLPLEPREKRVLLAVAARQFPDQGKTLLPLARRLDFYHDATSLCLRKVLK